MRKKIQNDDELPMRAFYPEGGGAKGVRASVCIEGGGSGCVHGVRQCSRGDDHLDTSEIPGVWAIFRHFFREGMFVFRERKAFLFPSLVDSAMFPLSPHPSPSLSGD